MQQRHLGAVTNQIVKRIYPVTRVAARPGQETPAAEAIVRSPPRNDRNSPQSFRLPATASNTPQSAPLAELVCQ